MGRVAGLADDLPGIGAEPSSQFKDRSGKRLAGEVVHRVVPPPEFLQLNDMAQSAELRIHILDPEKDAPGQLRGLLSDAVRSVTRSAIDLALLIERHGGGDGDLLGRSLPYAVPLSLPYPVSSIPDEPIMAAVAHLIAGHDGKGLFDQGRLPFLVDLDLILCSKGIQPRDVTSCALLLCVFISSHGESARRQEELRQETDKP